MSGSKIFYNNFNKLQIELLYALVNIAIGLEYIKNVWFQRFMDPLREPATFQACFPNLLWATPSKLSSVYSSRPPVAEQGSSGETITLCPQDIYAALQTYIFPNSLPEHTLNTLEHTYVFY